ncbi:MAG TPA: HAD-IA family hydrolase [Alphaproteobacteria bacterium]|nr:HAD-IA family hydrolase [Alphaproteobacteria bacterium]
MTSDAMLRLVVFDCDGTLVDSQDTIFAAVRAAFESCNLLPPLPAVARRVIGLPLREAMAALAPANCGIDTALLTARYKDAFVTARSRPDFEEPLFPGALQTLDVLQAEGYLLGIATGKGRRGLESTLARHNVLPRFVTLQTSDAGPGKPHPAMLERALAETGVEPAACVMVGDTTFDMQMAHAAGVKAVGVAWGYHAASELIAAGADIIVTAFAELPAAVRELVP